MVVSTLRGRVVNFTHLLSVRHGIDGCLFGCVFLNTPEYVCVRSLVEIFVCLDTLPTGSGYRDLDRSKLGLSHFLSFLL